MLNFEILDQMKILFNDEITKSRSYFRFSNFSSSSIAINSF